jgi:hypothetical protein
MPRSSLAVVIPHWPVDAEVNDALRTCLASVPADCHKLIVVNDGTGFARDVNLGISLASTDFVGVIGNDTVVVEGNLHDLCLPGTVASPIVVGKPGVERDGVHGACWVAPRRLFDEIGLLDERFEGAFFEDNDFLARLREAGVPRKTVTTVRVESRRIGLTMSKVPEQADRWYAANQQRFAEKWGWVPEPTDPELAEEPEFKRRRHGTEP